MKWSFSGRKPAHKLDSENTSNGSIKLIKNLLCKLAAESNVFFAKTMSMYLWIKLKDNIYQRYIKEGTFAIFREETAT